MPLLSELIRLPSRPLISLVGAGGKTTAMYTLAAELAAQGKRVITTTTTNIYLPKQGETDTLIVASETPRLLKMVNAAWGESRRVTVAGRVIGSGKLAGLSPEQPYELLTKGGADVVLVEADGARHSRIKAPAEHEPVMPPQTNVALLLMSAEAINRPLSAEVAHRPERVAAVLGIEQGDVLTSERVARLMVSEQGGMKGIVEGMGVYVLITHVREGQEEQARALGKLMGEYSEMVNVFYSEQPGAWFHANHTPGL